MDLNELGFGIFSLAPDELKPREETHGNLADLEFSPPWWRQSINKARGPLGLHVDLCLPQSVNLHLRRVLILDQNGQRLRRVVLDSDENFRFTADRKTSAKPS